MRNVLTSVCIHICAICERCVSWWMRRYFVFYENPSDAYHFNHIDIKSSMCCLARYIKYGHTHCVGKPGITRDIIQCFKWDFHHFTMNFSHINSNNKWTELPWITFFKHQKLSMGWSSLFQMMVPSLASSRATILLENSIKCDGMLLEFVNNIFHMKSNQIHPFLPLNRHGNQSKENNDQNEEI